MAVNGAQELAQCLEKIILVCSGGLDQSSNQK